MQELRRTEKKLIIGMVGLPARGKTHIAHKINRYLNWIGYRSEVFFLKNLVSEHVDYDIDFEIDPYNEKFIQMRSKLVELMQQKLFEFIKSGGDVALYHGLCYTKEERKQTMDTLKSMDNVQFFWIESICDDPEVILSNIRDSKLDSVADKQEGIQKFQTHLKTLTEKYQPIDEDNISYIKVINIGETVRLHQVQGYLQSKIISFMLNLHVHHRPIYLCRSGETAFNVEGKLGGDSLLTVKGIQFAQKLSEFFTKEVKHEQINLFTSTMKRSIQTATMIGDALNTKPIYSKTLDEIDYGLADSRYLTELAKLYQSQIVERKANPLDFKYPRGESFMDLIHRIEPIIIEIERLQTPVIVVTHVAIMRCLYAYFHLNQIPEIPNLEIPSNCIIRLDPGPYACKESRLFIDM